MTFFIFSTGTSGMSMDGLDVIPDTIGIVTGMSITFSTTGFNTFSTIGLITGISITFSTIRFDIIGLDTTGLVTTGLVTTWSC